MDDAQTPEAGCAFCGGPLRAAFEGMVLGRIPVTYFRCAACLSLQLTDPHWLAEAYGRRLVPDPDQGALARSCFVHRTIRRMRSRGLRLLPRRGHCLDFGCGRGLLLRLLLDDGHPAWGVDPYPKAVFAEDRVVEAPPEGPFDLITCIEVLEHTPDPVAVLEQLRSRLGPQGLLLVSTELHDPELHGTDWWYLDALQGQHISFATKEGLRRAAERAGLTWAFSIDHGGRPFLHAMHLPTHRIPAWKRGIFRLRQSTGEQRQRSDRKV